MRHLIPFAEPLHILIFVMTMTAAPSFSYASELCRQAFVQAPTEVQIQQAVESIARLKIMLDLAKSTQSQRPQHGLLAKQFEIKKIELQRALSLSNSQFEEKLKEKISALQKEIPTDHAARQEQRGILHQYKLTSSFPLKESLAGSPLSNHILNQDNNKLLLHGAYSTDIIDLTTNTAVSHIPRTDESVYLLKQNSFIGYSEKKFFSFDTNTFEQKELIFLDKDGQPLICEDRFSLRMSLSPGEKFILINDERNFYLFEATTHKLTYQGRFTDLSSANANTHQEKDRISFADDNSLIISWNGSLFTFNIKTTKPKQIATLPYDGAIKLFPMSDKKSLYIYPEAQAKLFKYDLKTKNIISKEVGPVRKIIEGANSESIILIKNYLSQAEQLRTSDLEQIDIQAVPEDLDNMEILKIPGHHLYAMFGHYPTKRAGLYSSEELDHEVFNFDLRYADGAQYKIWAQVVTADGKRIINIVGDSELRPYIETWELEN